MEITWAGFYVNASTLASTRYRILLPAQALAGLGYRITLLQLVPGAAVEDSIGAVRGQAVILPKLVSHANQPGMNDLLTGQVLAFVRAAKARGIKVIADINDDYFSHPELSGYYRALVAESDGIAAASGSMAEVVRRHTHKPVSVVTDPFEGHRNPPGFMPGAGVFSLAGLLRGRQGRRLRLLWFGQTVNFPAMSALLPGLQAFSERQPLSLTLITSPGAGAEALCAQSNAAPGQRCTLAFMPWSPQAVWSALAACDIVLIPTRMEDPTKLVKSPNRLVEGLRAGRWVVASPVPSYTEFADYAWIGDDLVAGLQWAVKRPAEVRRRIAAGQQYVLGNYSPEAVAAQWDNTIKAVLA